MSLKMWRGLWRNFHQFKRSERGVTAIVFALSLPMFIAAAGVAVDLAQAYNVKARLGNALDKAALAAGSTDGTSAEIKTQVENFFKANYPDDRLGTAYDIEVTLGNGNVIVSAHAKVSTTFMNILGQDHIDVYEETEVKRELAGVEVSLVLDVTGSMAGTKITALKNAVCNSASTTCKSTSFLGIMFDRISDKTYLKIGIVPFSQSVNVGPYGLGKDLNNANYGTAFVNKPSADDYKSPASGIVYSATGTSSNWMGCVTEVDSVSTHNNTRTYPKDTNDAASPNWGMYRYPKICSSTKNGVCQSYSNNDPNTGCPASPIVPLTNDKTVLATSVKNLVANGNTYGNVGMVWGYRVMTPSAPFTEGVSFEDKTWSRTVVMMTDGDNTVGTYSAYGYNSPLTTAQENSRFLEVCSLMKNNGITVYTIAFDDGGGISNTAKSILSSCASGTDKFYNASSSTIASVFEQIANHLSSLHIVR